MIKSAVSITLTRAAAVGSEVVDPHHSPLFTRQELVRAARSGGHLEGERGKGRERGVGKEGWGEGGVEGGRGRGEGEGGVICYTLMYIYTCNYIHVCTCTCTCHVKKQQKIMNHNSLRCEPLHTQAYKVTVKDAFRTIPGLISCARATGKVHFACTVHMSCTHAHVQHMQINIIP